MLRSRRESLHRNGITDLAPLQQTSATKSAKTGLMHRSRAGDPGRLQNVGSCRRVKAQRSRAGPFQLRSPAGLALSPVPLLLADADWRHAGDRVPANQVVLI